MSSKLETAKKLLEWNRRNLNAQADLKTAELADYFAEKFDVIANGRHYAATHQSYADFLNQMRADLNAIEYTTHNFIANEEYVVIPLLATLTKLKGNQEKFEAALILKFNAAGKIVLWQEVYTQV